MNLKKIFSFHPLLYFIIFIFLFMLVKNPQNGGLEGLENNNNNNELNSFVKEYMKSSTLIQDGLSVLVIRNKIKIPTGISNEIEENKRLKKKLTDILSKQ